MESPVNKTFVVTLIFSFSPPGTDRDHKGRRYTSVRSKGLRTSDVSTGKTDSFEVVHLS